MYGCLEGERLNLEIDMWKHSLAAGKPLELVVSGSALEPQMSKGDKVVIHRCPFADLKALDVVLCDVGGTIALRKICDARSSYGGMTIRVLDGEAARVVQERSVLGKVTSLTRKDGSRGGNQSAVTRTLAMLKRILLPGT